MCKKNQNYYPLTILYYLKKTYLCTKLRIERLEHETELEARNHDIPAAGNAGELWGLARGI